MELCGSVLLVSKEQSQPVLLGQISGAGHRFQRDLLLQLSSGTSVVDRGLRRHNSVSHLIKQFPTTLSFLHVTRLDIPDAWAPQPIPGCHGQLQFPEYCLSGTATGVRSSCTKVLGVEGREGECCVTAWE